MDEARTGHKDQPRTGRKDQPMIGRKDQPRTGRKDQKMTGHKDQWESQRQVVRTSGRTKDRQNKKSNRPSKQQTVALRTLYVAGTPPAEKRRTRESTEREPGRQIGGGAGMSRGPRADKRGTLEASEREPGRQSGEGSARCAVIKAGREQP